MNPSSLPAEITVEKLAQRLAETDPNLQLVDVREPNEVEIAAIEGFTLFPLSQYDKWSSDIKNHLDPDKETLVLCHHGSRSAQMCQWLRQQGFTDVKNIVGGIDAYSIQVDNNVPRY